MYKDKLGRQHGFACSKGPTGPKGNCESNSDYKDFNSFGPHSYIYVPSYGSMTPEEYFKFRTEGVVKQKCSDENLIHLNPKDFYSFSFKILNSECLEDNPTMGLIEWREKQVLKDKLEAEQEQLDAKVKKLEAFLTNKEKLKDLKFKQIQLLHKQLSGMKTYLEALTERIKNL